MLGASVLRYRQPARNKAAMKGLYFKGTKAMGFKSVLGGIAMVALASGAAAGQASTADNRSVVAAMDLEYQAAVKRGDTDTMDRILHPDFALVRGDGRIVSREDIIEGARSGAYRYEQQDEIPGTQSVRLWGDTAVVTALLWVKGTHQGEPFDRKVWFSDTYVLTPDGWRYAFAQVSLPLPDQQN